MRYIGTIVNEWRGIIEGEALVSRSRISFLGDVNPKTGIIRDPTSDISGKSIMNKILIFKGGRGSTVGALVLYALKKYRKAPKMIVTVESDLVVISGAIFANIPMITNVSSKIITEVKTGDIVKAWIEGNRGVIEVFRNVFD